jgi:hypothetical protein
VRFEKTFYEKLEILISWFFDWETIRSQRGAGRPPAQSASHRANKFCRVGIANVQLSAKANRFNIRKAQRVKWKCCRFVGFSGSGLRPDRFLICVIRILTIIPLVARSKTKRGKRQGSKQGRMSISANYARPTGPVRHIRPHHGDAAETPGEP